MSFCLSAILASHCCGSILADFETSCHFAICAYLSRVNFTHECSRKEILPGRSRGATGIGGTGAPSDASKAKGKFSLELFVEGPMSQSAGKVQNSQQVVYITSDIPIQMKLVLSRLRLFELVGEHRWVAAGPSVLCSMFGLQLQSIVCLNEHQNMACLASVEPKRRIDRLRSRRISHMKVGGAPRASGPYSTSNGVDHPRKLIGVELIANTAVFTSFATFVSLWPRPKRQTCVQHKLALPERL